MPPEEQWKLPLTLAITVHLLVFGSALLPSSFFNSRPKILDIQTVSLFNANELNSALQGGAAGKPSKPEPKPATAKEPEPPKPEEKPEAKPEPKPESKPEPIPEPEPPPKVEPKAAPLAVEKPAPTPPAKAISIAPRAEKTKIVDPKLQAKEESLKSQAIDRIKDKLREKEAVRKAQDQIANLRDRLHAARPAPSAPAPSKPSLENSSASGSNASGMSRPGTAGAGGGSVITDLILRTYYADIQGRISQFWILPEIQNWDEKLEAIVVLTIRRDGVITKSSFEKKSDNVYFNRFIEKTIQEASPLPPFPATIKESEMEIGFRFRPSGLY